MNWRSGEMLALHSLKNCALVVLALIVLVLPLSPAPTFAQSADPPPSVPPGSYDEEEAQKIDRMLMCPVCPAESIDQAQVELAHQMRAKVRELLSEGLRRRQVLEYFVNRYGIEVLAAPPKTGISLLAWVVPIGSVLLGIAAGFVILRSMTRKAPPSPLADDQDLEPYLSAIDRGLSLEESARTRSESQPMRGPDIPGKRDNNG